MGATILGNLFSIMMVVGPASDAPLSVKGLEVWQRSASGSDKAPTYLRADRKVRVLKITGMNTNGIVTGVCGLFAQRGVNLINVASEMAPAPFTDDPMFKMRAVIDMPEKMEE